MPQDRVLYNGVSMIPEWPAFIEAAQSITHYEIGGRQLPRIRYGDEADDWGADHRPCHDCGVIKGQYHVGQSCDVERCPSCGGQVISCDCDYSLTEEGDDSES
jgi:hypothetical protein